MSRCRAVMQRLVSFPPACGALCPGCEICCDLVVEQHYHHPTTALQSSSVCADRTRKPNGDAPPSSSATQRRSRTAGDSTPGGTLIVATEAAGGGRTTTRDDGESADEGKEHDTRMSRGPDGPSRRLLRHEGPCATRGRWPAKSCRANVTCDCDVCLAARTCCGCPRNCAARRARYKGRKLHCAALCCTGRSTCCSGRSLSPRRRDCRCLVRRY